MKGNFVVSFVKLKLKVYLISLKLVYFLQFDSITFSFIVVNSLFSDILN